jgi:ankyrin repeat protein
MLPWHYAVNGGYAAPMLENELIRFLVEQEPAAVRRASAEVMLPVHYAILHAYSLGAVHRMVQEYPESLHVTVPRGASALHLAAIRDVPSLPLVRFSRRPETGRTVGHRHQRGRHRCTVPSVLSNRQPMEMVRFLVERQPRVLDVRDKSTGSLLLHDVAGTFADATVELVELLIEHSPDSVNVRDTNGSLPLHPAVFVDRGGAAPGGTPVPPHRASARKTRIPSGARGGVAAMMRDAPLELLLLVVQVPRTTCGWPCGSHDARKSHRRATTTTTTTTTTTAIRASACCPPTAVATAGPVTAAAHTTKKKPRSSLPQLFPNMPYELISSLCLHVRAGARFVSGALVGSAASRPAARGADDPHRLLRAPPSKQMRRPPLLLLSAIDPSLLRWNAAGGDDSRARGEAVVGRRRPQQQQHRVTLYDGRNASFVS